MDMECTFQPNLGLTRHSTRGRGKTEGDSGGGGGKEEEEEEGGSRVETLYNKGKLKQARGSEPIAIEGGGPVPLLWRGCLLSSQLDFLFLRKRWRCFIEKMVCKNADFWCCSVVNVLFIFV